MDIVIESVNRFKKMAAEAADSGREFDLFKAIDGCTTDVMQWIVLGEQMPPLVAEELGNMVWHLENQVMKLWRYHTLLPSFRRTMRNLDKFLYGIIERRRKVSGLTFSCPEALRCNFQGLFFGMRRKYKSIPRCRDMTV